MEILGAIGLFLLGMSLLTEGLQAMTSDSLSRIIKYMTQSKWRGLALGTAITAVLQSSSATTLLTIGFVNSGVLSFQQAIGVIFGTNLGTTLTSWLISTIGLNVSIKAMALPMIGIGVLLKFSKLRSLHAIGTGLCGFGLLFFGIDLLQAAMANYAEYITLEIFDTETFASRLLIIIIGLLMSFIMQSSSAAMATTLTALFGGLINFEAACYLVIGQNIGTTLTAVLGAFNASVAAKRTAGAHVLFNILAALMAVIVLPIFLFAYQWVDLNMFTIDPPMALSFFHTLFQILGLLICMPFTSLIAKKLESWIAPSVDSFAVHFTRELCLKEITGAKVALSIINNKLAEIFFLIETEISKEKFRASAPEIFNHCYLYISQINMHNQDEEAQEIRLELLRGLENLRAGHLTEVDEFTLKRLDSLVALGELRTMIDFHLTKMHDHLKIDVVEFVPDWDEENSLADFSHIQQKYQSIRFDLLKKGASLGLDHFTTGRYLDVLKNYILRATHLMKTHQHLSKVNRLSAGIGEEEASYKESESDSRPESSFEDRY